MKRFFAAFFTLAISMMALAQTPEEILKKMGENMDKINADAGLTLTVDIKIPILGTASSRTYALGEKMRMELTMLGETVVSWVDGDTTWEYNADKNKVVIKHTKDSSETDKQAQGDLSLFSDANDGYDLSIKNETDTEWTIYCKKSRSNKDKDAPKNMTLVVAKGSYMPVSLSAKISSFTMTMHDFVFGKPQKKVYFDKADFPGVTIEDQRTKE